MSDTAARATRPSARRGLDRAVTDDVDHHTQEVTMRDLVVRRPEQGRLTFDRRHLWQTLPDPDRRHDGQLVGPRLPAVHEAEGQRQGARMNEKIRTEHLERAAYVYVRRSSLRQVRHHREGQRRQYGLTDRARQLGFARVVVIDDDLGTSGTGRVARPGFGGCSRPCVKGRSARCWRWRPLAWRATIATGIT